MVNSQLVEALHNGDLDEVTKLIASGKDIHFVDEHGYDALITAVYGRDILRDDRLIPLLSLLISHGVSLKGKSSYGESAVLVLSRIGRFDAVKFLLDAGADPNDIGYTELIEAVVFGSLKDVENIIKKGVDLEDCDFWERTAWLMAIQIGDIEKAKRLLEYGAKQDAQGRCGKPPLFYAIENWHIPMMRWLIETGIDIQKTDEFGTTALMLASSSGNVEAVDLLLQSGADVNTKSKYNTALNETTNRDIALKLLGHGADPRELEYRGRRAVLGYSLLSDETIWPISQDDFNRYWSNSYGKQNPDIMNNPFWIYMIRSGITAWKAYQFLSTEPDYCGNPKHPIWCAESFGQSITIFDDGRIIQIAGEHEDGYDPDFCIYNDVFVHQPDGEITIYGYPEDIFPPTDFHTATLIDDYIYIIGSLGYYGCRNYGYTPVYRLNTQTFVITPLTTTGENPGWISRHRATKLNDHEIEITEGKIITQGKKKDKYTDNKKTYILDLYTLGWRKSNKKGSANGM